MTKSELIQYSASKVKRDKTLFAEFIRLYEEELGYKPNCATCKFQNTFNNWKKQTTMFNLKMKKEVEEVNKANTFELKGKGKIIRIPFTVKILKADSPDKIALEYLNQEEGKYRKAREAVFATLPTEGKSDEDETDEDETDEGGLSEFTKKELVDFANLKGIKIVNSKANKPVILKAVEDGLSKLAEAEVELEEDFKEDLS